MIKQNTQHLFLLTLIALTLVVYWSGLNGPFLFDDFANLTALGDYNGVRNWETLKLYLNSGHAGPTGRPIALLSFLIDAKNWPADPWRFKFTNLLLHLINGILLYSISFKIALLTGKKEKEAIIFSLLATGLWLLHPFFTSTVLYPVQRMAILPATFTLLGFWLYLQGRQCIKHYKRRALLYLSSAIGICTLLAVFSKENGILLPLLLALFEYFILQHSTLPKLPKKWKLFFLALPSVVIIGAFIYKVPDFLYGYSNRDFTFIERLLTQSRALISYLAHLFFPQAITNGLYTDSFLKSISLINPISTLFSLLTLILIATTAWIVKKRFPLFSFAIFFFFTAHIVESSIIPLELYYEHRNYLPALFLFLPLAALIAKLPVKYPYAKILPILMLVTLSFITFIRADIWSNEEQLMLAWAERNPQSIRAQRMAILVLEKNGNHAKADIILDSALLNHSENHALLADKIRMACHFKENTNQAIEKLERNLGKSALDYHYMPYITTVLTETTPENCLGVTHQQVLELVHAVSSNSSVKKSKGLQRQLHHTKGVIALNKKHYKEARFAFQYSLELMPSPSTGMAQVALLAENKSFQQALIHLNFVEKNVITKTKESDIDYRTEIPRIRRLLQEDMQSDK